MRIKVSILLLMIFSSIKVSAQVDEDQVGAWYMYFWNAAIKDSQLGFQGDIQFRNWNILGDLEQLLLRGGATYIPDKTNLKLTLGYANITIGAFGEDNDNTFVENRIYQEVLLPQIIASRIYLFHRFRYEQRWVENQDFRTRYRYFLNVNVPFNRQDLKKGAVYLALYNEIFINGQKDIGNGRNVEFFDRNRFYVALGYSLSDKLRTQLGFMEQSTDNISKGQVQISLHHTFGL